MLSDTAVSKRKAIPRLIRAAITSAAGRCLQASHALASRARPQLIRPSHQARDQSPVQNWQV
jgi:hypothetical protein